VECRQEFLREKYTRARSGDNRLPCEVIMCRFDRAQKISSRSDVCWRDFSSAKALGEGHRNGI
jgi:hypothetical protein